MEKIFLVQVTYYDIDSHYSHIITARKDRTEAEKLVEYNEKRENVITDFAYEYNKRVEDIIHDDNFDIKVMSYVLPPLLEQYPEEHRETLRSLVVYTDEDDWTSCEFHIFKDHAVYEIIEVEVL